MVQIAKFHQWGRRRDKDTWSYSLSDEPALFAERGFTAHEHLEDFKLNNMNGRLYDPVVGRFLSPDPYVQDPGNSQSFNRYSYCLNNPLKYNDPSGDKWDWTILNPFHYLDNIMQWVNDKTPKLRQAMVDAKIPAFGAGYNTNFGQFHYINNSGNIYPGLENKIASGQQRINNDILSFSGMGMPAEDNWSAPTFQFVGQSPLANGVLRDIGDGFTNVGGHPLTSLGLQVGDDALRYIGLTKYIPGINLAANTLGGYAFSRDMNNPNLSNERKMYRTMSNGVPAALSTTGMIIPYLGFSASFATGLGEIAVFIGVAGWAGEQIYDRAIVPASQYGAQLQMNFEKWFIDSGYKSWYSDKSLKNNIKPLDSSLVKVLQLYGYTYTWKDSLLNMDHENDIGLIAQEVEKIYPEIIAEDNKGIKMVSYYKLIPVLIEAIKEQQKIISNQMNQIEKYNTRVDSNEIILENVLQRLDGLLKEKVELDKIKNKNASDNILKAF